MLKLTAGLSKLTLLLVLTGIGFAQTNEQPEEITKEKLTAVAKIFFRDVSEFPMRLDTKLVTVKSPGDVAKSKNATADLTFRGGWKKPFGELVLRPSGSFSPALISGGFMPIVRAMGNTSLWSAVPAAVLIDDSSRFELEMVQKNAPLKLRLIPQQSCPAFAMTLQPQVYMPDQLCGRTSLELDEDLSFHRYEFDAAGLPAPADIAPFGKCTLQSYHVEAEFHKVMLPADDMPFLVPRSVVVTMQTNKGKVEFTSTFEPSQVKIVS